MNIVLIGYRGTGKTEVGMLLSAKLGWPVMALDNLIAQREKRSIPEIVETCGWDYFRAVEAEITAEVSVHDGAILDTGGGVVLQQQNITNLKNNGLLFWLKARPETIIERIKDDANRPALIPGKTFTEEVAEVLAQRHNHYHAAADFEIETDGKPVSQITDEILGYASPFIKPSPIHLTVNERSRYLRQILIPQWGNAGQAKLRSATVFIAGAGGLGCPAAIFLAAAGVGRIRICDFGRVELTNLNRQILYRGNDVGKEKVYCAAEALRQINPHVEITPLFEKITDETIRSVAGNSTLMLDCLDNFETRHVLNRYAVSSRIPFIHAGIEGFAGQLAFIKSPQTPCLYCMFPGSVPVKKIFPVVGVTPGIIGTLQATEAVKWIVGIGENLFGKLLVWDGELMQFQKIEIKRDLHCPVCGQ